MATDTADGIGVKVERQEGGEGWTLYNGDSCVILPGFPDDSIPLTVFSPPFAALYVYSDRVEDMGNNSSYDAFFEQFRIIVPELFRVTQPGRLVVVHCADVPLMKERDGVIGLNDFSGDLVREFKAVDFIYHSRVTIGKDPLVEATRTKALGLMHKQLMKDSAICRVGLPDYLLCFRKPGENDVPIEHAHGLEYYVGTEDPGEHHRGIEKSHHRFRGYATPIWLDVRPSRTLNYRMARDQNDERHVCPFSLDTTERCVHLWSRPGEVVLDPFAGIGSTGYSALLQGRKFVGIELKDTYFDAACKHLRIAEAERRNKDKTLF